MSAGTKFSASNATGPSRTASSASCCSPAASAGFRNLGSARASRASTRKRSRATEFSSRARPCISRILSRVRTRGPRAERSTTESSSKSCARPQRPRPTSHASRPRFSICGRTTALSVALFTNKAERPTALTRPSLWLWTAAPRGSAEI
eukprot:Amastigsp_a179812_22.p3 type:complete len:149 gc:universal Amastigsp_a179812_22:263-709(+)